MDNAKKAEFVRKMGKGRIKLSKGGLIRMVAGRKYFDGGGTVSKQNDMMLTGPDKGGTNQNATNPNSGFLGTINQGLGLNNNFEATAADIQRGTNAAQLNAAYTGANNALDAQGNLVSTLTPQATSAVSNQNDLALQLAAMTRGEGPNPAAAELAQNTAANVAQTGAEMAGARGASGNVGLMARQIGQRGAATQQTAAGQEATLKAQQQIAAQQNLANLANNQISQTGQATTGLNSAAQNEQALLQNANTSANNAAVGMQSNINNTNAQTSAANQNMAANTMGGIMSAVSGASSMFGKDGGLVEKEHHVKLAEMNAVSLKHGKKYGEGGEVEAPDLGNFKASDDDASSPNIASGASLPADQTDFAKSMQKQGGGGGGGMSSMMGLLALADGGPVPLSPNPLIGQSGMNSPGNWVPGSFNPGIASSGPSIGNAVTLPANKESFSKDVENLSKSSKGKGSQSSASSISPGASGGLSNDSMSTLKDYAFADGGNVCEGPHRSHVANFLFADGGKVPAMLSPGEIYLSPDNVHKVIHEGANPMKVGQKIHGKASKKNDSLKNDTVPMDLEAGGVVIPRHITTHKMSAEKAELFVHRALARKKARN